jgi:hypothetical protein
MHRRQFIQISAAALFSTLILGKSGVESIAMPADLEHWQMGDPLNKSGPAPKPEITAAVDVLVPADPDIPGDFTGSDYHADWVLAASVGDLGQIAIVFYLNKYARQVAGAKFLQCSPDEQLEAIRQWIREREEMLPTLNEMLTGLLTLSMVGTYEDNTAEESLELFESMSWYDPDDPAGSFRLPNEGYTDVNKFPVTLKKGLRK